MIDRRQALAGGGALLFGAGLARGQAPTAAEPVESPIVLQDDRVWVAASIAGSKPYLFIIDTGAASNIIRNAVASELRLLPMGSERLIGMGRAKEHVTVVQAHDLRFGSGIHLGEVRFDRSDSLDHLPSDAAGLLDAGVLTGFDSDLDFEHGAWRLWPKGRPDRSGLTMLDSAIQAPAFGGSGARRIVVTALLDGKPYRLLADTGAPSLLVLQPSAARRSGLFADDVPYAPAISMGFGGMAAKPSRQVRAQRLVLGPVTMERPIVTVMDPHQFSWIDGGDGVDGLVGLATLRLLNLSVDTKRQKLWVSRNGLPPLPMRYRATGLWLRAADGATLVDEVGTGSPAAAAGIRPGDRIVSPASFAEATRMADTPPGRDVSLVIERDGKTLDKTFTVHVYL